MYKRGIFYLYEVYLWLIEARSQGCSSPLPRDPLGSHSVLAQGCLVKRFLMVPVF